MPNVYDRITAPSGAVREGTLNEHGQAGCYQIESGNCKITSNRSFAFIRDAGISAASNPAK